MTEQNKKNSRLQLNEGTIYVDAESIVFKPQAFKACGLKTIDKTWILRQTRNRD